PPPGATGRTPAPTALQGGGTRRTTKPRRAGAAPAALGPAVTAGVEEEFHVVDLATRRLTGRADRLVARLPAGNFTAELQRSVLEANSRPRASLADLAEDLAALRPAAVPRAAPLRARGV